MGHAVCIPPSAAMEGKLTTCPFGIFPEIHTQSPQPILAMQKDLVWGAATKGEPFSSRSAAGWEPGALVHLPTCPGPGTS